MSEKFKRAVNKPNQAIFRVAEQKMKSVGDNGISTQRRMARALGGMITGAGGAIVWMLTKIAMDNPLINASEKMFRSNGKKAAHLRALLEWWLVLSSMVATGNFAVKFARDITKTGKELRVNDDRDDTPVVCENTFGAYKARIRPLMPLLLANLVAHEGTVVDPKTGLLVVYDDRTREPLKPGQKPKGRATIGFGTTVLMDGTQVSSNTPPMTYEDAYKNACAHIEDVETMYLMYCYTVGCDTLSVKNEGEALGMLSFMYNGGPVIEQETDRNHRERNAMLRDLLKEHGDNVPDSLVLNVFKKYPVRKMTGVGRKWLSNSEASEIGNEMGRWLFSGGKIQRGLFTRRVVEYGLMTGEIDARDLLDVPLNKMSEFLERQGGKRTDFWLGNGANYHIKPGVIDDFKQWLENPVDTKGHEITSIRVRDVLPADVVAACESGMCKFADTDRDAKKSTFVINPGIFAKARAKINRKSRAGMPDVHAINQAENDI